jgi:hypothetical protein
MQLIRKLRKKLKDLSVENLDSCYIVINHVRRIIQFFREGIESYDEYSTKSSIDTFSSNYTSVALF